jgi:transcriptional regulator with PAS, ATPase and Fis domain
MLGTAPSMNEIFRLMESAAASSITVLIEGETGTGKELVARGIHRASARAEGPFLAVNCAAMPDTLLESELFGHRRGAFTGAVRDNAGLFRSAMGGSVFLDEVGDMALPMQAKLLRVLEEEEVVPLGASFPLKVDVRVMSATNRDLRAEVRRGNFREDLYYRLAVFPVKLPPLRERREDIPPLALRFLNEAAERNRKKMAGFSVEVLALMTQFEWPGNVRQLQNEIQRAVAIARENEVIGLEHLSPTVRGQDSLREAAPIPRASVAGGLLAIAAVPPNSDMHRSQTDEEAVAGANGNGAGDDDARGEGSLREARAAFEARYIGDVLRRCGGNVSRAAELLGMSRVSLHRKVKEYGLR